MLAVARLFEQLGDREAADAATLVVGVDVDAPQHRAEVFLGASTSKFALTNPTTSSPSSTTRCQVVCGFTTVAAMP